MAWYSIPSDPTQRNYLLGGLVFIAAAVLWHMYPLTSRREANLTVRTRVESLAEQNRRAEVIAARGGGDLEERMLLYERHVARLEELIPAREEVPQLLDDITRRARLVDVEVTSLVPEPPVASEFYTSWAYSMAVVGEYHAVAQFLTEIASLSRIVTSTQLDVALASNAQQYADWVSPVQASFRIETYVLPEPGSQPPAAEVGS
jgi:type IV pilus assembly protein PilO